MSSTASHPELELRCVFCASAPLLGVAGRDRDGQPFIHIKAQRSRGRNGTPRLHAEVVVTAGVARIRCPRCLRWHRIAIRREAVEFRASALPEAISV